MLNNQFDKQKIPFVTPDSMRKVLKLLKNLYAGYTSTSLGYTDINGLKYEGSVCNFGSELLLEARKMLMDRPPIEIVFPNNDMKFYFDILYSELISTYEQQVMFVGTLKKDSLLSDRTYRIIFRDCTDKIILRSPSWSDPNVIKDKFITTSTAPVLQIDDGNEVIEVPLTVSDNDGSEITYGFNVNLATNRFIESYTDGTLTTVELNYRMDNLPFIWIYSDAFQIYPTLTIDNNIDVNNNPLLTVGTDGHDICHLYPMIYEHNFPYTEEDEANWWLKVIPVNQSAFDDGIDNTSIEVNKILYVYGTSPWDYTSSYELTYNHEFVKIFLDGDIEWGYHTPVVGDTDYNSTTYINKKYAYVNMEEWFIRNHLDEKVDMVPAFTIKFDHMYLNKYEHMLLNGVTGIHSETCSDYSTNGVMKKNGYIHELGDFDGLPKYTKMLRNKKEHRSHVEMYSIRDRLNRVNQKVMDKQCSALILDSGVPKSDMDDIKDDLSITIEYDFEQKSAYHTIGESESSTNWLTSLGYVVDKTNVQGFIFADTSIPKYVPASKFVYHGGGLFTLSANEPDPELEYGRVFVISNDENKYENNDKTSYKKPERTLARICDIPTAFSQLTHVTGVAPTVIIDDKYIRTNAPYERDEQNTLWNVIQNKWVTLNSSKLGFYSDDFDLDVFLSKSALLSMDGEYVRKKNLSPYILGLDWSHLVANGGEGYEVGDTFSYYVGGYLFEGVVDEVNDGRVTVYIGNMPIEFGTALSNLGTQSPISYKKTETTSGSGNGLVLKFTVLPQIWDEVSNIYTDELFDGLFVLKFDQYGYLWFWEFDNETSSWIKRSQITGPTITYNPYDDINTMDKRTINDVMMYHILNTDNSTSLNEINCVDITIDSTIPTSTDIDSIVTLSGPNYQSSYYTIYNDGESSNYQIACKSHFEDSYKGYYNRLPRYNMSNLSYVQKLGMTISECVDMNKPMMVYFDPHKTTRDTITDMVGNTVMIDSQIMTYDDVDENGYLTRPVFKYNEFSTHDAYVNMYNQLSLLSREALVSTLRSMFPDSNVLDYEGTEYAYSSEELITYIMCNYGNTLGYYNPSISRIRQRGEKVYDYDTHGNIINRYGEQPSGGFHVIADIVKPDVRMNDKQYTVDITKVFKLDEEIDLTDFRIFDDTNNDVSSNSLLIMNNEKYVFINDEWVNI